jgi:hypothetical protein
MNSYINDILCQPTALRGALENYPAEQLQPLRSRLLKGDFDRIVLSGMGSSLNAAYPTWFDLIPLTLPVVFQHSRASPLWTEHDWRANSPVDQFAVRAQR